MRSTYIPIIHPVLEASTVDMHMDTLSSAEDNAWHKEVYPG